MARERRNPPPPPEGGRPRTRAPGDAPEVELSDEELRALADEGVDPDEAQRVVRERPDDAEVGEFDRDTAREELEGLASEQDDER